VCTQSLACKEMPANAKSKLVQHHRGEIDGWDLMSWVATINQESADEVDALDELINLDDLYADKYHKRAAITRSSR